MVPRAGRPRRSLAKRSAKGPRFGDGASGARPPQPQLRRRRELQKPAEDRMRAGLCRMINFECDLAWTRFGAINAAGAQDDVAGGKIDKPSRGGVGRWDWYGDVGFASVETLDRNTASTSANDKRRQGIDGEVRWCGVLHFAENHGAAAGRLFACPAFLAGVAAHLVAVDDATGHLTILLADPYRPADDGFAPTGVEIADDHSVACTQMNDLPQS